MFISNISSSTYTPLCNSKLASSSGADPSQFMIWPVVRYYSVHLSVSIINFIYLTSPPESVVGLS